MKLQGFTYIEVILTVALLIFMGVMASPFYGNFLFTQEKNATVDELRESMHKARFYSMMGKNNSSWGVALSGNRIVLFKGTSFDNREAAFDESYVIHDRVTVSGFNQVVFAQRTGVPDGEQTITVLLSGDDSPHTLTVNGAGAIDETY